MKLRIFLAALLSFAIPLPAFAQPHAIAQLGTAPLIGRISSTAQLQNDVTRQRRLFEAAGTKLGLTPKEYAQFEARISARELAYVTLPRHLDAMSWSSEGTVYVLRDVTIPAGTKGWEIDLREGRSETALFIPARCGNLSVVRRVLPAIAQAAPRPVMVEAAATQPPQPAPTLAPAPVLVAPATPAATPAPYQSVASSTGPRHHLGWWPLLLVPIAALIFHGGGGSNGIAPSISSAPIPAAPTPAPVVGCTPPPSH